MSFMNINYGIEHHAPWCRDMSVLPPGIEHIWVEPKEIRKVDGHEYPYHPYSPTIFDIQDGTKIIIDCCQNFKYLDGKKEYVRDWFAIKPEKVLEYETLLQGAYITLDKDTCVINVRGGEYLAVKDFSLTTNYWSGAINKMVEWNSKMKFIVVTDDVTYAKSIFPYPVVHFGIGCDYYMVNQAKNLIISNSSFGMFPAWLNPNNPYVIAPLYWARYNVSNGFWAYTEVNEPFWHWLNREGKYECV